MRTPVFTSRHYRLIAEALKAHLDTPDLAGVKSRDNRVEDIMLAIDALEGLFTADNPSFEQGTFQAAMDVDTGPPTQDSIWRANRILTINGIGE